jgi:hypothetical protein
LQANTGAFMEITLADEIKNKVFLRPKEVEKWYGIAVPVIYRWYRTEKDTGVAAPIRISNPDAKGSRMVFVEHKSVIDYLNRGLNKPQS